MTIDCLEQPCLEQGLRMSDQWRAIFRVLDQAQDHPSVEEIYERAIQYDRHLSIATVYRTVNMLAEWGLLSRIELGDGKARHEEARGGHHEHLVDVDTGKVVELSDQAIQDLLQQVAQRCGYQLLDYQLELFGEAPSGTASRGPRRPARSVPVHGLRTASLSPLANRRPDARQI